MPILFMAELNKDILKELGLTTNEIEVYLKLLSGGSITVNTLAERTGMHRQACYDALDRLLEKGFVSFVIKDGKKHFQSLPPEQLLVYAENLASQIGGTIPELKRLASKEKYTTQVEVYRGKNVVRTVLRDIISMLKETNGEVLIIGVLESKFRKYGKAATEKYIQDMQKFGLKEKLLSVEGTEDFIPGKQSEYRLLPKEYFNPNPCYIYGNKVVFMVWEDPSYAISITSEDVSDANRKYFNLLWKIAKPVEKD